MIQCNYKGIDWLISNGRDRFMRRRRYNNNLRRTQVKGPFDGQTSGKIFIHRRSNLKKRISQVQDTEPLGSVFSCINDIVMDFLES